MSLIESAAYARSIVETIREPLLILTGDLKVDSANRSFFETFQVKPAETVGRYVYDLGSGQWDIPPLRRLLEEILPSNHTIDEYEVEHDFPRIGRRVMLLNACRVASRSAPRPRFSWRFRTSPRIGVRRWHCERARNGSGS